MRRETTERVPRVVALGEVLWDLFPDGARLGGAPSNFAVHAASLGAESVLVSRVGKDERGREVREALEAAGVEVAHVQADTSRPTGIVRVSLTDGQPTYEIVEGAAWDAIDWVPDLEALARSADAVCFGTLAQRCDTSRRSIQAFVGATREDCLKVLDINFRQHYHSEAVARSALCFADVLKLSDEEVPILRDYVGGSPDEKVFVLDLMASFEIGRVVLTRGAAGCLTVGPEGVHEVPSAPREVVNTVGAGDAFAAAFLLGLLAGESDRACAEWANCVGGYVVTQDSGTPAFPEGYRIF